MNKNILQIDKNNCLVVDETGKFSIVSSDNKTIEIMEKENVLEEKYKLLKKYKDEFCAIKYQKKLKIVTTVIESILLSWTLFITIHKGFPVWAISCSVLFFNFPLSIIFDSICGTFWGNRKKFNELDCNIKKLEIECLKLKNELSDLKNINNFKRISKGSSNENHVCKLQTLFIDVKDEQEDKQNVKKKVLKKY